MGGILPCPAHLTTSRAAPSWGLVATEPLKALQHTRNHTKRWHMSGGRRQRTRILVVQQQQQQPGRWTHAAAWERELKGKWLASAESMAATLPPIEVRISSNCFTVPEAAPSPTIISKEATCPLSSLPGLERRLTIQERADRGGATTAGHDGYA